MSSIANLRYHDILPYDNLNGEGMRTVIFLSGCAHACPGCHNKSTWKLTSGKPLTEDVLIDLLDMIEKSDGLTLSGGDPLHPRNIGGSLELAALVKENFPDKDIWCWTGYLYEELPELPNIDVLVDGKYKRELPPAKWVGSCNQRVIRL